jgi:transaldolase
MGEILELAGCDLLTISPGLLGELESSFETLEPKLDPETSVHMDLERITLDEKDFRWMHNEDAMAVEKLSDGIRRFTADLIRLEEFMSSKMN